MIEVTIHGVQAASSALKAPSLVLQLAVGRGVSWGGFGGLGPPGHRRGTKKKKKEKERKGKEKERGKEGKKGKKKEKDKSRLRIGRHSSTSRGAPEGLQGRKLEGRRIHGRGGEGAILQICSRAPKLMTHGAP